MNVNYRRETVAVRTWCRSYWSMVVLLVGLGSSTAQVYADKNPDQTTYLNLASCPVIPNPDKNFTQRNIYQDITDPSKYPQVVNDAAEFLRQNPGCLVSAYAYYKALDTYRTRITPDERDLKQSSIIDLDRKIIPLLEFIIKNKDSVVCADNSPPSANQDFCPFIKSEGASLSGDTLKNQKAYYEQDLDWHKSASYRKSTTIAGGVLLGAGALTIVGGLTMREYDNQPVDCNDPRAWMPCKWVVNPTANAALYVGGAVMIAGGLVLTLVGQVHYKSKSHPK